MGDVVPHWRERGVREFRPKADLCDRFMVSLLTQTILNMSEQTANEQHEITITYVP